MATTTKTSEAPARGRRRGRTKTTRSNAGHVQSLARALSILNTLMEADAGLTLTDVAQRLGLAPSTAHRLLTTMQETRFTRFDLERNVWLVGVQAFLVGNAFARSRDVISMSRGYMRQLMEESGETVNLAVEDQGEAVYLGQVECRQMMRAIAKPGGRVPLHCSGVGKALLSALPDAEVARILQKRGLARVTAKTIDSPARLREQLAEGRARGYVFDDEEHAVGLRCVASVIYDEHAQPMAALSLSGPMARIGDERVPLLGTLVMKTAAELTSVLGGKLPKRAG
jgi:IclR family acetate operon transcriptional repressor